MRYSVVGLGKLGCSMAAAIASRGYDVIGHDVQPGVVAALAAGRAPVQETGLAELIAAHRSRLRATHSLDEVVAGSDITFVVVPTPSDGRGAFLLDYARAAFAGLGHALATKQQRHTVVLTSTVLPGATRYGLMPALESAGAIVGSNVGVCYSPAFIALGSVVRDFLHPDLVLVGESDAAAGAMLEQAYREILPGQPPVRRMTLENAELAKLAVNTFVTTKISFANMLADLCERIPGADVDVVTDALGLDRRIGRHYLTGALGYGGPCFPRDNQALSFIARAVGTAAPVADATDAVNRMLPDRIAARVAAAISAGQTVAVLGLAYKPDTAVIDESQSVLIARALAAAGARVVGHDPLAGPAVRHAHGDAIRVLDDVQSCIDVADVVLITTPDRAYAQLGAAQFTRDGRRRMVIDFWRTHAHTLSDAAGVDYHALGRGSTGGPSEALLCELWGAAQTTVPG
ncbi:MAG TPA: nucleotide sugar dehydrogenase [Longimicrobiales bacterium]|nr:nucleotide sugar dehydrogenase [Longimicrobiales bacterium]